MFETALCRDDIGRRGRSGGEAGRERRQKGTDRKGEPAGVEGGRVKERQEGSEHEGRQKLRGGKEGMGNRSGGGQEERG